MRIAIQRQRDRGVPGQGLRDLGMHTGGGEAADVLVPQGVEVKDPICFIAEGQERRGFTFLAFLRGRRLANPGGAGGSKVHLYHLGRVIDPVARPQALLRRPA
ncbi:MAG TPA: hypothetical protein VGZ25_13235 [Gemmataceae bacterium]|nr:hypothetical protein [Gemmataceae bacterium]